MKITNNGGVVTQGEPEIINTGIIRGGPGLVGDMGWDEMSKEELIEELHKQDGWLHDNAWKIRDYKNKFNAMVEEQVNAQMKAITDDPSVRDLLDKARVKIVYEGGKI